LVKIIDFRFPFPFPFVFPFLSRFFLFFLKFGKQHIDSGIGIEVAITALEILKECVKIKWRQNFYLIHPFFYILNVPFPLFFSAFNTLFAFNTRGDSVITTFGCVFEAKTTKQKELGSFLLIYGISTVSMLLSLFM
jgi:hypothetical protein